MIRPLLHTVDPYEGFPYPSYPVDVWGWGSEDPIFEQVIREVRPKVIFEIGSWLGASAIHMASILKDLGIVAEIVCIDTWLGSCEFWNTHDNDIRRTAIRDDETRYTALRLRHGYPSVYYQFLANVMQRCHQDTITPFPQTSSAAAEWFTRKKLTADAIYVDGSHSYEDVLADLKAYWPLLRKGGIMWGDDLDTCTDVRKALDAVRIGYETPDNRKWIIRK